MLTTEAPPLDTMRQRWQHSSFVWSALIRRAITFGDSDSWRDAHMAGIAERAAWAAYMAAIEPTTTTTTTEEN